MAKTFSSDFDANLHAKSGKKDGQIAADENELGSLLSIGHFGHLRTSEIAMVVWPDSPAESGQKMTRRTLKRLLQAKEILGRPNSLGGLSFVLTKRGAARLQSFGFKFADGYDIQGVQGPTFWHRTLATAYLVSKTREATVLGEYAIAKARHALGKTRLLDRYKKLPDGLILTRGKTLGFDVDLVASWVEVESSFKPDQELEKMLGQAWQLGHFMDPGERVLLDDMILVYDIRAGHEARLIKTAKRMQARDMKRRRDAGESSVAAEDYRAIWGSVRLVAADTSPPLSIRGWHEKTLLECLEG
jgi:hypothetical protein